VADVRDVLLRTEPRRTIYVPQAQASSRLSTLLGAMPVFLARPRSGGADVERTLREAVHAADPSLPPPQVFPLDTALARSLAHSASLTFGDGQGVGPVIAGLVIDVAGAIGLSRFVAGFLWG
jgi:hypothetical protein